MRQTTMAGPTRGLPEWLAQASKPPCQLSRMGDEFGSDIVPPARLRLGTIEGTCGNRHAASNSGRPAGRLTNRTGRRRRGQLGLGILSRHSFMYRLSQHALQDDESRKLKFANTRCFVRCNARRRKDGMVCLRSASAVRLMTDSWVADVQRKKGPMEFGG